MKIERTLKTNSSTAKKNLGKKRRHTRLQLDSLRPMLVDFHDSHCPKCQGYVRTEAGESLNQIVVRCLNCGWQPHFQIPIIQETEEARSLRELTTQFVSECDWNRISVNF